MKARRSDNPEGYVLIEETRREQAPASPSLRLRQVSDDPERRVVGGEEVIYDLQNTWQTSNARLVLCERAKADQVSPPLRVGVLSSHSV